eukprot:EG_transcript_1761
MPPPPKEPRSSPEQTSPHRLAHYNHVVRLPTQSARYTLANTRVEVERRAPCNPAIASEVRKDATGSRVGIALGSSSPSAAPVVFCISGPRVLLWRISGDGPLQQQVNVSAFILNDPSALEAAVVGQGRSLLLVHRLTCRAFFFRDVFRQPQAMSKLALATSANDEAVARFSQQGDHVVIVTTQQNVFVIGPKDFESTQPLTPFICRTGRSFWGLGALFSKPEDPIIHAQWSAEDECLVVVKGNVVEKWRAGAKVSSFALEGDLEFRALQVQSADVIHVLYSGCPKPTATADDAMAEDTDGLKYCVAHYKAGTLEGSTPLKFSYPQASKCYVACSARLLPGGSTPQCIVVGLDNLLVTSRDGNEDVLYDDFFMFGYVASSSALFLLRTSGLWGLKFPAPEVEEFAQPEEVPALPVGVTAANAVAHSKRIVDGSIANPVGWAAAAPVVDDASSGLLLAKAIARKRAAHRSFMAALCSTKIWDAMSQGDRRRVHEHGEKLAMCYALRKFQNDQHVAKGKPGHARQAHAFLAATLEEVVAAADRDLPSDTKMSVQERFFSHASQVQRLLELLSSLRDNPVKWSDTLQKFGLTPQTMVTFTNTVFLELFRSILAHRDVYGRSQALQDFGRMEWTRLDPFLQLISRQLALTHDVIADLAGANVKTSDGLLGATEAIQRLTTSSDAVLLDPAGELLKQQADLVDYVLEFTADDGRASPTAIALVQKYLMEFAVGPRKVADGRRRASPLAHWVREPVRALAEKWRLFDMLIELSRTAPEAPPDPQLMQQYLQRFEGEGFHTALFQHHLQHKDWRSLLAVEGVDQPLAEFLDRHNVAMAAVHRLRFARGLEPPAAAAELQTSAALFRDAAQRQLNLRERKASLSMAKLVLHLHSTTSPADTNSRLVMHDLNKELKVIKLQEVFLQEPEYLAPEPAIEKLSAAALTTAHRQQRQDKLQAALLLNQQRLDCDEAERTRCEKEIWAYIWQAEETDWRQLAQLCRDGISDPDMRQHLEGSLFCTLRYTPEGETLTRDMFHDLRKTGRL